MGLDFLRFIKISIDWSAKGDLSLSCAKQILIESIEISMECPKINIKHEINIPLIILMILDVEADIQSKGLNQLCDIEPNYFLTKEYPNLVIITTIHRTDAFEPVVIQALKPENSNIPADKQSPDSLTTTTVPCVVVNLAINDLCLCKGEILGSLQHTELKVNEITIETVYEASLIN